MQKRDFEKCCHNIDNGSDVYVQNVVNRERGHVLFCTADRFHVEVGGRRDSWLPQVCESDIPPSH